jgi:AcrR family transcriptional regulator
MVRTTPPATRKRILDSALALFSRYGFKRTSMEDISSEAGLSRAALYLQFRNKEDIFRELATGLHEQCLSTAEAALAGDAPLAKRLQAAVEAKTLPMIEIAANSPHGAELMDERNRLCGDLASDSERRFVTMLTEALEHADRAGEVDLAASGLTANAAADVFAAAVHGLKGPDLTTPGYMNRVASFVRVFVAGLRRR